MFDLFVGIKTAADECIELNLRRLQNIHAKTWRRSENACPAGELQACCICC